MELRGGMKIGNNLFYMDDLKVIADSTEKAEENHYLLQQEFQNLGMMRNEAKCGVFTKGLRIQDEMNGIPRVTQETPYKYLGIEMEETTQSRTLIERLKEEVKGKLEEIKSLRASGINTIRMINSMVISKLRNTFAAIPWKMSDLDWFNKKIRKCLYESECYSQTLASERLYLRPEYLGLSLMDVRVEHLKEIIRTWTKLARNKDEATRKIMEEITKTLPKKSLIHQARKAAKYVFEKNEIEELIKENMDLETFCERIENKFQEKLVKSLKEKKQSGLWKQMEEPND